jgi:hypothetical protein
MNPLMHNSPFSSKQVFVPHLLNLDQRALPLAKKQVLQGGQGDEVVFGVHIVTCYLIYYPY